MRGKGELIVVNELKDVAIKGLAIAEANKRFPDIVLYEENEIGLKGVTWSVVKNKDGNDVLSIVNLGKTPAKISLKPRYGNKNLRFNDLLTGTTEASSFTLDIDEVRLLELN